MQLTHEHHEDLRVHIGLRACAEYIAIGIDRTNKVDIVGQLFQRESNGGVTGPPDSPSVTHIRKPALIDRYQYAAFHHLI